MPQMNFDDLLNGEFTPSNDADWEFLKGAAQNLFKPKKPIDDDKLFAGRLPQINQLLEATYEEGGHAIIFGERGVGKTSLARILEKKVAPVFPNIRVPEPISCGTEDDFYTIWGNAFTTSMQTGGPRQNSFATPRTHMPYIMPLQTWTIGISTS